MTSTNVARMAETSVHHCTKR